MTTAVPPPRSGAQPVYDTAADVAHNLGGPRGPLRWQSIQVREALDDGTGPTLFGRRLRGVVGIPACPLTADAAWVSAMAGAGFDVLTHKTVRSREHPAHAFPQWLLGRAVEVPGADALVVRPGGGADSGGAHGGGAGGDRVSSANSFGVPSPTPAVWQADLESCLEVLASGQVLIASVMGSPEVHAGPALVADFVRVARLAADVGVSAAELNLSCPNTLHPGGSGVSAPICADPAAAADVVEAVRSALPARVAVVAKLSALPAPRLAEVVARIGPAVAAVAGMNTLQRRVLDATGRPAFGPARVLAGVSGAAVTEAGLAFVRTVRSVRDASGAGYAILGMGGVLTPDDVAAQLAAGADVVQSATGACLDPDLAERCRALARARSGSSAGSGPGSAPVPADAVAR